jgi:protein transport protein SEC24
MLPVTDMDTTNAANALNDPVSTIQLPQAVRAAADNLLPEKAYLIENGLVLFLWIGLGVVPQWAQDVFGVSAVPHIDTEKVGIDDGCLGSKLWLFPD